MMSVVDVVEEMNQKIQAIKAIISCMNLKTVELRILGSK